MKKVYLTIGAILCLIMLLSGGMCITVPIDEEEMVETHPIVQNPVDNVQNFIQEESVPVIEAAEQPEPIPTTVPAQSYTEEELEILSIIVYQEAGGNACSDDTRRLVAQVFINRVNDERFPDTFYDVATAERQRSDSTEDYIGLVLYGQTVQNMRVSRLLFNEREISPKKFLNPLNNTAHLKLCFSLNMFKEKSTCIRTDFISATKKVIT